MARDDRFAKVRLDVDPDHPSPAVPVDDRPFRIAVLGDFRARGGDGTTSADPLDRPIRVDRDDLESVLARLAPRLTVGGRDVVFRSLDDFHPDRLHEQLPALAPLHALRAEAARPSQRAGPAAADQGGPLLDRILDAMPGTRADLGAVAESRDLAGYIRRIVEPHLIDTPTPDQAAAVAQVDAAIAAVLRAFLHQPEVQALESLWRGLDFLVRRVETSTDLTIHLVDAPYESVARGSAALGGVLRRDDGWAVVLACYPIGADPTDLAVLGQLATLGRQLGAPVLAGASTALADLATTGGDGESATAWGEIRHGEAAAYLGLCYPRVLLRLPYGPDTDPCERFAFTEMPAGPDQRHYLWGHPAFAAGVLLAEAFTDHGWGMRPGSALEVQRLPLHVWRDAAGTTRALPCTDSVLTEDAAFRLLDSGIMPLVAIRDRDTARLLRFQSVADPATPLAGPWIRR